MAEILQIVELAKQMKCSDIHISVGLPICFGLTEH